MARIRTIKPDFWTDETMVRLPYEARLLFIGIWNFADDQGRFWDEPERLKMQVFPGDAHLDVAELLDLLEAAGRIERLLDPDGKRLWCVPRFGDHQRVDKPSKSALPDLATCRKLAIPNSARRAVAAKYGCEPGQTKPVTCYYCGEPGQIRWWVLPTGKPSSWVTFSLELDHFEPEANGGASVDGNLVLACRACNRSKGTTHGTDFLASKISASPREDSRAFANTRDGREGNGREGNVVDGKDGARQVAPPAAPAAAPVDLPPTSSILFFAWTQQARAEAFPGVFPENPPRGYEAWYERALGEVGDEGRLRGAFRAFLRDGWAAKLRPLGTIQAFIGKDNWRKHVPAAEAAPKPKREWVKVTPPEAA